MPRIRSRAATPEHGRRIGDPLVGPADPGTRAMRGRLAGVSVRASLGAGAWVGFALGLVAGVVAGAILVWFSGAVLEWQRDLAFTFGIARRLLPFGDQVGLLHSFEVNWWLVIPAVGIAVGVFGAVVGALVGGLLAAAYNRSPRHALVIVELPAALPEPGAMPGATSATDGIIVTDGATPADGGTASADGASAGSSDGRSIPLEPSRRGR